MIPTTWKLNKQVCEEEREKGKTPNGGNVFQRA
jgi:hypothetical protein